MDEPMCMSTVRGGHCSRLVFVVKACILVVKWRLLFFVAGQSFSGKLKKVCSTGDHGCIEQDCSVRFDQAASAESCPGCLEGSRWRGRCSILRKGTTLMLKAKPGAATDRTCNDKKTGLRPGKVLDMIPMCRFKRISSVRGSSVIKGAGCGCHCSRGLSAVKNIPELLLLCPGLAQIVQYQLFFMLRCLGLLELVYFLLGAIEFHGNQFYRHQLVSCSNIDRGIIVCWSGYPLLCRCARSLSENVICARLGVILKKYCSEVSVDSDIEYMSPLIYCILPRYLRYVKKTILGGKRGLRYHIYACAYFLSAP